MQVEPLKKNGIVYCDFDGTLIDTNIEKLFIKFLMKKKYITLSQILVAIPSNFINHVFMLFSYGNIIKAWTFQRDLDEISNLIDEFLTDNCTKMKVNQSVVNLLHDLSKEHEIVILTGSYQLLVQNYLKQSNFGNVVDRVIGTITGKHGFIVLRHPYGKNKCKYIQHNRQTVGIANEVVDQFYLQLCSDAKMVCDDSEVARLCKQRKWEMIKSVWT